MGGFESCCIATFGSRIVYELIGHGVPGIYMDPDGRNRQFVSNEIEGWHATDYMQFRQMAEVFVQECADADFDKGYNDMLCLNSRTVSKRVYDAFRMSA